MKKVMYTITIIITLLLSNIACSKNSVFDKIAEVSNNCDKRKTTLPDTVVKTSFNVLAIGNSLSNDALGYTPFLLREVCPDKDINLNILYRGATTLRKHWELIDKGLNEHVLERCSISDECWQKEDSVMGGGILLSRSNGTWSSYNKVVQLHTAMMTPNHLSVCLPITFIPFRQKHLLRICFASREWFIQLKVPYMTEQ